MKNCKIVSFERYDEYHPKIYDPLKSPSSNNSSETTASDDLDDISLLKDLFFNLKTTSRTDWSNINVEKRHDFKFWAEVTHYLGFDVLKSVFSIGSLYFDDYNVNTYHIKSVYGDELCSSSNYIITLKNEVAFQLLSGMIENRVPGSLRLIIRGNGYSFFENRINELLRNKDINQEAICHNMNSIIILFPYLLEYESVNLSHICFQFVTSKLWKYMWSYIGVQLKKESNNSDEKLFITFLELSTIFFYGARGPGLLKRLHTSSTSYLWNSIISLISWSINKKVLCKIISFVCDILLLSISDSSHEYIPKDVFKVLKHNVNRSLERAKEEGFGPNDKLSEYDFVTYYSNICVSMLDMLLKILDVKPQDLDKNVGLVYYLSTLGNSKVTIPYNCNDLNNDTVIKSDLFVNQKIFPRGLPCFNYDCTKIYHIDLPQVHATNNEKINFFYCEKCGIPSYCSERCRNQHWEISHKEMCPYFMNFPTFAKYSPKSDMSVVSTLEDSNFNCIDDQFKSNWKLIF